ncbi:MAG: type II toxin-antitoxin system RelE/ParE family toxin [Candidatus Omnitrophota bacterium]|jgi:hypothetical protein|nr:MAG: type II toxin-antitoxin system RelE/ParE family toxin [Candidatus Omnitrophota bacterium]
MPETEVYFYQEDNGDIPFKEWLNIVSRMEKRAVQKCLAHIELLKKYGNELRRPHVDYLKEGIYELRFSYKRTPYRILYFFHGQNVVIISHGVKKEKEVLVGDIEKALQRKRKVEKYPKKYIFREKIDV